MPMLDDSLTSPCPRAAARSFLAIYPNSRYLASLLALSILFSSGCTTPLQYVRNGFKVGPNYETPAVPTAKQWIEADDQRVRSETDDLSRWWKVFHDPALDNLVADANGQNLSLKQAGYRILEAPLSTRHHHRQHHAAIAKHEWRVYAHRAFQGHGQQFSQLRPSRRRSGISVNGTSASTWPGSLISGAVFAGPSSRIPPVSTRRSQTTTTSL